MAVSLVAHGAAASTDGNSVTTASLNTTGATILVACVGSYPNTCTLTDSNGNTWTVGTAQSSSPGVAQLFWCLNPTVGTGHTFTATGSTDYPSIAVAAFSGLTSPSLGGQNGSTTPSTGSVTATAGGLVVVGMETNNTGSSTISGFTVTDQITYPTSSGMGTALAWQSPSSGGSVSGTWSNADNAVIAAFASGSAPTSQQGLLASLI